MNTNTSQVHIDNARGKLTALLDKLCAAEHATTAPTVESITKVAQTLHYLCTPPFPGSLAVEPVPKPEPLTGETNAPTNAAGPEPTPGPVDAEPDTIDRFLAVLRKAAENCQCPRCTASRKATNASVEAAKRAMGDDAPASFRAIEIPISPSLIARALGLNV